MAIVKGTAVAQGTYKRIGNIVFRQTKSGTVAAQRPVTMGNPRTDAQMSQRIRLANLVTFYRASKQWMRKAFETKERKQSDFNAFVKANLANNPVALTKSEAAAGACVLYPYRISMGSLPPVSISSVGDIAVSDLFIGDGGDLVETIGTGLYFKENATIAALSELLLANNLTLRSGDQVSFLQYKISQVDSTPYAVCTPYELIIDITDGRRIADVWPTRDAEGNIPVCVGGTAGALALAVDQTTISAFALVISRTESGTTRVSRANLVVADSTLYSYYTSAEHVAEAAASYGEQVSVFLDSDTEISPAAQNTSETRAVIGFEVNDSSDVGSYYPAGATAPNGITAGKEIQIIVSGRVAVSEIELYRDNGEGGLQRFSDWNAPSDFTQSGNRLVKTLSDSINSKIARITVTWQDGYSANADFA